MNQRYRYALASLLSVIGAASTFGAASRVAYIDAFATARGNAFTATADNPSAVFYNSAGLTQIEGTEFHGNLYAISIDSEYSTPFGSAQSDSNIRPVPSLFAAHNFESAPIALGFGLYTPFALGADWGASSVLAPAGYESDLTYLKAHAVIAWQVTDTFSVGIGPSYDYADVTLKTAGPLGAFDGDGDTVGFSLSARWQPNEHHAFGINYQANTEVDFEGNWTAVPGNSEANLEFPESIVAGYSWRPNEKWNIEFNLDWTNWDRVNDLTLTNPLAPAPTKVALNWESSFIWELGATRYFDNGWNASVGYTFVENSVPGSTLTPLVPDGDKHFIAAGVGREYEHFTWSLAGQYGFLGEERSVTTGGVPVDYDLPSYAVAFSIGYKL